MKETDKEMVDKELYDALFNDYHKLELAYKDECDSCISLQQSLDEARAELSGMKFVLQMLRKG